MIVVKDIIASLSVSVNATSASVTREFIIQTDGYESMFSLIDADQIPSIDEAHPEGYLNALGLTVSQKVITAIDPRTFRVNVQYDYDKSKAIGISSTVVSAETNRSGQLPRDLFPVLESLANPDMPKCTPTVTKMIPSMTIEFGQRISGFVPTYQKLISYIGKVNASSFFGGVEGQWLCVNAAAESTDGGKTYVATFGYLFSDQPGKTSGRKGHNCQEVLLNDDKTRLPVANASVEDGSMQREIAVYDTQELSFPGVS